MSIHYTGDLNLFSKGTHKGLAQEKEVCMRLREPFRKTKIKKIIARPLKQKTETLLMEQRSIHRIWKLKSIVHEFNIKHLLDTQSIQNLEKKRIDVNHIRLDYLVYLFMLVKNPPTIQETPGRFLGREFPLEKR